MLECVVNVSEGRDAAAIAAIGAAAGPDLLDVHSDPDHHRSVFTLVGEAAPRQVTETAVARLDLGRHAGAHPRLGVVDVVPFVALDGSTDDDARLARDRFCRWASDELHLPCFVYGTERTLPEVRRRAFVDLLPDHGPSQPHPTAGAVAVGHRPLLVAYNLWLAEPDLDLARRIARELRSPTVRALGLQVGNEVQVSCNLIDPMTTGPGAVADLVAERAKVARAELVGLIPEAVLAAEPPARWTELDLAPEGTIEARIAGTSRRGASR